jgi:hypothetical protein
VGALVAWRRPSVGGLALGLAVLVKAIAVLPAAAILLVGWRRQSHRNAVRTAVAATVTTVGAYLALGRLRAARLALDAAGGVSRASVWRWVGHLTSATHVVAVVALVAAAVVAWPVIRRARSQPEAVSGGTAGLAYLLTGAYVMPWYPGAVLPLMATATNAALVLLAQAQAAILALAYVVPPGRPIQGVFAVWAVGVVPVLEVVLLVGLLRVWDGTQTSRSSSAIGRRVARTLAPLADTRPAAAAKPTTPR